jgi:ADP-ribosylglycohydrolase
MAPETKVRTPTDLGARVRGAILAGAAGDALGWPLESIRWPSVVERTFGAARIETFQPWHSKAGGCFNRYLEAIEAGAYSDDTQLVLVVARCTRPDGTLDEERLAKVELPGWLDYARGAGPSNLVPARKAARKRTRWFDNFFVDGEVAYRTHSSNGPLVRASPLVLANAREAEPPLEALFRQAIVTHGDPYAHVAVLAYGAALHHVLGARARPPAEAVLGAVESTLRRWEPWETESPELAEWLGLWEEGGGRYRTAFRRAVKAVLADLRIAGGSAPLEERLEAVGCLTSATKVEARGALAGGFAIFLEAEDAYDAIATAANSLKADTDALAVVAGTFAGALWGDDALPDELLASLQDASYLARTADRLTAIALRKSGPSAEPAEDASLPHPLELVEAGAVRRGARVFHPAVGAGSVVELAADPIDSARGGVMRRALVSCDSGQSCWFRTFARE